MPTAADAADILRGTLRAFPGIVTRRVAAEGSHAHAVDEKVIVALVFASGPQGRVARLVIDFIMSHMGRERRLDSHAPVARSEKPKGHWGTPDADYYLCEPRQATIAARMLRYASADTQGPKRPRAQPIDWPLPVLLSHAFVAFEKEYRQLAAAQDDAPSLGIWGNVLRAIPEAGLDKRELPGRTVLSLRGMRAVLRDLERRGWLQVEKQGRGAYLLRLTSAGQRAQALAPKLMATVERRWRRRFGAELFTTLQQSLADIVRQFDVCWPWYLTGYGPGDSSVTGGSHVPASAGPPRIPAHGADWPVVIRNAAQTKAKVPLLALLSEALAGFASDYRSDAFGYGAGLGDTSNLLASIKGTGMALEEAAAQGDVSGNGKSGMERHLVVVVEPGKPKDGSRRVYLTPKGQRARDSHAYLVVAVEKAWQRRYGKAVPALRKALLRLDPQLGDGLPNYPNTTAWYWESLLIGGQKRESG